MNTLSIGYFGDGRWSHNAFSRLLSDPSISVAFVCARHQAPDAELLMMAENANVPAFTLANVNSPTSLSKIRSFACDLLVSMSFDQIFGKELIRLAPLTAINCHAGKLPFYRGRNVLNWVLINDEREFGITVHFIDEGIDTGDIILQRTYSIADADTYASLLERAHIGCADVLFDAICGIINGTAERMRQSEIHPHGMYCTKRIEGDERINWNRSSREVFSFVRALSKPGPIARSTGPRGELRISRVELLTDAPRYIGIPGAVLSVSGEEFLIKTADTFVKVVEWEGAAVRIGDRLQ